MSRRESLFTEGITEQIDFRHARLRSLRAPLVTALLLCCAGFGCEGEGEFDMQAMAPTALCWLDSVGPGDSWGRAVFVEQGREPKRVDFQLVMQGLDPGRYAVRLRSTSGCDAPSEDRADLLRVSIEVEGKVATEHRSQLEKVDLSEEGPLVGGSVVVEIAEDYEAGKPVACGAVEYIGVLNDESRGRWQGPRPTP